MSDPVQHGELSKFTVTGHLRAGKLFCRALTKVAFEVLCHDLGRDACLDPKLDPVRNYILRGIGTRQVLTRRELVLKSDGTQHVMPRVGSRLVPYGPSGFVALIGVGAEFIVDLTPQGRAAAEIYDSLDPELRSNAVLFSDDHLKARRDKQSRRARRDRGKSHD